VGQNHFDVAREWFIVNAKDKKTLGCTLLNVAMNDTAAFHGERAIRGGRIVGA
jgi:hypothetical protein